MNAFVPKGRTIAKIAVPLSPTKWVMRSTGTRDPRTAKKMQAMVRTMGRRGERAFDLFAKLGTREWSLMELYERYVRHRGDIAAMRSELDDVALADYRTPFLTAVRARAGEDTAAHYGHYLDSLMAAGVTRRSQLTVDALATWLEALRFKPATRRKYAAGASAFCTFLVRKRLLAANPMRDVEKPKKPKPRVQFLETADAIRLADAQPSPYRELSALLAGTALDVSVALGLTRRQVDLQTWGITSRRPKSQRAHSLLIAEWARPYVARLCHGKIGDAPLFVGVDRFAAGKQHRAACTALGIKNYWMKDARHTWAVRFGRAGGTPAQGAEQLGHGDGGVLFLSTYAVYLVSLAERQAIDDAATQQDATRAEGRGA